jgi:hypothetical protein
MAVPRLSRLTPAVVDGIYGTAAATPKEAPVFVWLVGAPGAGKSTGHRHAIEHGFVEPGNYATVNLDSLLESLLPFRVGSSMAHMVTHMYPNVAKFASIGSYQTKKENVGAFGWYNTAHNALEERDPALVSALDDIREQFARLKDKEKSRSLISKNEAALQRAIDKRVDIIYETTLSVNKEGRVAKFDELMGALADTPYTVKVIHVTAPAENIAARVAARQEYGMPYENRPFYRMVPPSATKPLVVGTARGVAAIHAQYPDIQVVEIENPANPAIAQAAREFDPMELMGRIAAAYRRPPGEEGGASASPATSSEVRRSRAPVKRTTAKKTKEAGGAAAPKRKATTRKASTGAGGKKKTNSSSDSSSSE